VASVKHLPTNLKVVCVILSSLVSVWCLLA